VLEANGSEQGIDQHCFVGFRSRSTQPTNYELSSDLDAKELIQELKSISKMLQSLHSSLKKL